MRIALLYPHADPTSPVHWSGTPHGLAQGLVALGHEVVPLGCDMPASLRLPLALLSRWRGARGTVAHREPVCALARSHVLAQALAKAGPLDALIAMGTDLYDLSRVLGERHLPVATFDDGCFAQFMRYADSDLHQQAYPEAAVQGWARRQAVACRRADAACVSTGWAGRALVDEMALPRERVRVVGMGHRPRRAATNRDWREPHLLFVGVDWRRKNGARVLKAFASLRAARPAATLDVVGQHPALMQAGVTAHGYLPREDGRAQALLDRLYARATAFVLPSLFDPSPIACLEAASAGLPVIATRCGGSAELLGDGAIAVDPHDDAQIAQAMDRLADGTTAQAMGTQASRHAAGCNWTDVARRIVASVTGAPTAPSPPATRKAAP